MALYGFAAGELGQGGRGVGHRLTATAFSKNKKKYHIQIQIDIDQFLSYTNLDNKFCSKFYQCAVTSDSQSAYQSNRFTR